jgi:hypothetical protein
LGNVTDVEENARLEVALDEYREWRDDAIRLSKSGSQR